jgi:hypothetical protein
MMSKGAANGEEARAQALVHTSMCTCGESSLLKLRTRQTLVVRSISSSTAHDSPDSLLSDSASDSSYGVRSSPIMVDNPK